MGTIFHAIVIYRLLVHVFIKEAERSTCMCMEDTFQITLESMLVQKSLTAVFINNINLLHPLVKQGIDIKNGLLYIQIRLMSMND